MDDDNVNFRVKHMVKKTSMDLALWNNTDFFL